MAGLILTTAIVAIIVVIWVSEPARMAAEVEKQAGRSIERGVALFDNYCAGCHGLQGEGVAGLTPPLNVEDLWAGRDRLQFYGTLHDYLYLTTAAGHTKFGMPAWADEYGGPLRNDQIEDLVQFIVNWQGAQPEGVRLEAIPTPKVPTGEVPAPPQEADPVNGAALFANWCAACHGPGGDGTNLGPPINRAGVLAKDDDFLRIITSEGLPGTSMIDFKGRLAVQEIGDVIAFMRTWEPAQPAAPGEGNPARGATLYFGNCAPCHGLSGEGDALGPSLNLTDVLAKDDDFLRTITREGIPGTAMIDFGTRMSAQDIDDIIAFMRIWQPKARPRPGEGDAASGAQVYASTCAACHGADGEGTAIGPALNRAELLAKGDDSLRAATGEGIPGTSMLAFEDRLTDQEIKDVVAFIRSWSQGPSAEGDAVSGAQGYASTCAACHGADGEGTAIGPALNRAELLAKGDDFLRATTGEGIPGTSMLAFADRLTDQEIEDIIVFLRSWETGVQAQPSPTPEAPPTAEQPTAGGDAGRGAELYTANCAPCHGSEGQGGAVAKEPLNSAEYLEGQSDNDLRQAIGDGVGTAMPGFGGKLTAQEIADLIAFLRSKQ
jgi:mono/diheme cytochrome c family protein